MAAGIWLGWEFLTPYIAEWNEGSQAGFSAERLPWIGAGLGAILGGVASWPLNLVLGWFFHAFNQLFDLSTSLYTWSVGRLVKISVLVLAVYGGLLGLTYFGFAQTPKGFIPTQDKGYLLVNLQLPDSASLGRTQAP